MATLKLYSFLLLAAPALAISVPVGAAEKTKTVKHNDLDLSTAAGQEQLNVRIKRAVKQVCESPRPKTAQEFMDRYSCEMRSMAVVKPKIKQTIAAYLDGQRFASRNRNAIVGN